IPRTRNATLGGRGFSEPVVNGLEQPAQRLQHNVASVAIRPSLAWDLARPFVGLLLVIGPGPVLASSVLVPDDFASVQSAINSGADTIQVRVGTYAERPIVDHPLVLEGLGSGPHPRLGGLEILNSNFWPVPPLLSVSQVDFSAAVHHTTVY